LRFYRAHFFIVLWLSLAFYLAMGLLAAVSLAEFGFGVAAILALSYLALVSIFWLQAPLAPFVDDVRSGRPHAGLSSTLSRIAPRLGSVTGGSFLAALGVWAAGYLLVVPGLVLLARWALLIPVIVIEEKSAFQSFARSNQLVRRHTGRVVVELIVSGLLLLFIGLFAQALLQGISSRWVSIPIVLLFLAFVTPPIPLMRILSYYDLVEASAKTATSAEPIAHE
jgi:hypothetical protein